VVAKSATVKWTVVQDNWPKIIHDLEQNAGAIVAKAALDIEAGAKLRAPVLTGFLRGSVQASQIAERHWRVTVGADYGIYQEYGTVHIPPRPYFEPAINEVWPGFQDAMRKVLG
jgi:HK97 gp10 family phage protein